MEICIVGTGYVGLVTAACFAETGNNVYCVDIDPAVVESLNSGRIHIFEPGLEAMVKRNVEGRRLMFTTELADGLENALFVFICVGTPSNPDGSCDLTYVNRVGISIVRSGAPHVRKSEMESYLTDSGLIESHRRLIRLDVMNPETDEPRLIEGIKTLISE